MRSLVIVAGLRDTATIVGRAARRLGYPTADVDIIKESSPAAFSKGLTSGYDVVYLIADAEISSGEPTLRLADGSSGWTSVKWSDLTTALSQRPPRLIVLDSTPESRNPARRVDAGALMSIAARFAEVGVLAVLVVPPFLEASAADTALSIFFREVRQHGSTERAMVAAHSWLREQPRFWPLTLYSSTEQGAIWYLPGFQEKTSYYDEWAAIRDNIESALATPVIGPEVAERYSGTEREFANQLAAELGFEPNHLDLGSVTK